ncbi:MAG: zinc ribbon domain-containing protein [Deltaproteobacteria bacterium]|nr:zinc ribbon domain-containing protein [Deltaproteobacteria bacterium]
MPTYEYRCKDCGKDFTVVMTMAEHDRRKVLCPACKGKDVAQQFSLFYARTSKKS